MGRVGCVTGMLTYHESVHAQAAFENAPFFVVEPTFSQHCLEPFYVHERRLKRVLKAIGYASYRHLRITQPFRFTRVVLEVANKSFQNRRLIPCRHCRNVNNTITTSRSELLQLLSQLRAIRGRTESYRTIAVDSPLDSPVSPLQLSVSAGS